MGEFSSATSRQVFVDGVAATASTTTRTIGSTFDRVTIGTRFDDSSVLNALCQWPAIWNVALSQTDVDILYFGADPRIVRSTGLVCFMPYLGRDSPGIDIIGGLTFSVTGTTSSSSEPRAVRVPRGRKIILPASSGATLVSAATDALAITEHSAAVNLSRTVAAGVDALAIAEAAATVNLSRTVAAALDALVITERTAGVGLAKTIAAGTDSLALTEQQATVNLGSQAIRLYKKSEA